MLGGLRCHEAHGQNNNGYNGPRALRARDLVVRSWAQELTNYFESHLYPHSLYELGEALNLSEPLIPVYKIRDNSTSLTGWPGGLNGIMM